MREWVDAVLFARHEVVTFERNGKTRGRSSGARVMHTTWTAAYDAKNRFDLPETLPLAWEELEAAVRAAAPADPSKLRAELNELIPRLNDPQKAEKALREWAGNNPARLAQLLDKIRGKLALQESGEEDGR
jgi:DNA-directed RNA polymerase specialized sigma24 family protein